MKKRAKIVAAAATGLFGASLLVGPVGSAQADTECIELGGGYNLCLGIESSTVHFQIAAVLNNELSGANLGLVLSCYEFAEAVGTLDAALALGGGFDHIVLPGLPPAPLGCSEIYTNLP